tara:strand:+ start:354 stop:2504 length:2151 start_codon:yes stop_codon:yes gene_type:complete
MYSDKILAVVREYSCNAVDANKEAGYPDKPIEIKLPSRISPEFSVRDYGQGLTLEDIETIYTKYGESTKRHSNEYIGMLGIGCKSAFAYSDNFIVKSYLDGELSCYEALIDPSKVGKITLLGKSKTDEANGVEVTIPVKKDDEDIFHRKAKDFFNHFKIKPIIKGHKNFFEEEKEPLLKGKGWEWAASDNDNYHRNQGGTLAIMGNVAYKINKDSLKELPDDKIDNLLSPNLRLYFDIGELNIAASREQLEYTDRTIKAIVDKLVEVKQEIKNTINEKFKTEDTFYGAKVIYNELFDFSSGYYNLSRIIEKVDWKGTQIDSGEIFITYYGSDKITGVEVSLYEKSRRTQKYRKVNKSTIAPKSNTILCENDLKSNRGLYQRVSGLIDKGKDVYVLKFDSKQDEKDFYKKTKIDCVVKKLSTIEIPKKSKTLYSQTVQEYNPKNNVKILSINVDASSRKDTDYWEPVTKNAKTDSGYYLEINRYKPIGLDTKIQTHRSGYGYGRGVKDKMDMRDFINCYNKLTKIVKSLPNIDGIYGVKSATVKNLGKGWVNLMNLIEAEVENHLEEFDLYKLAVNREDRRHTSGEFKWLVTDSSSFIKFKKILGNDHKFIQFLKGFLLIDDNRDLEKRHEDIRISMAMFGKNIEKAVSSGKGNKSYKKAEKFEKEYPMLELIGKDRHSYGRNSFSSESDIEKIAKYIELEDLSLSNDMRSYLSSSI